MLTIFSSLRSQRRQAPENGHHQTTTTTISLSLLFSLNAQLPSFSNLSPSLYNNIDGLNPKRPRNFQMKIRQFLVRLDETWTMDHFPFILRFGFEHARLESPSISRETKSPVSG
ncbi:hypothetical protein C1H46_040416 [Malus baccata]|uniref:Uncharacterized protein n=1 Tax=Malus baccata TaxID=106549 RepID=A0A540KIR5_MALBA|nr:hypothetical protein C1H46_040416 [Malus baccata]